jgi:hypothetical protein
LTELEKVSDEGTSATDWLVITVATDTESAADGRELSDTVMAFAALPPCAMVEEDKVTVTTLQQAVVMVFLVVRAVVMDIRVP